jgi:hypothetical protein
MKRLQDQGITPYRGANDAYRVPKRDWKINEVSARIGAQWVTVPQAFQVLISVRTL